MEDRPMARYWRESWATTLSDIFGGPSTEEVAAGLTAHGEASVAPYAIDAIANTLIARATSRSPH